MERPHPIARAGKPAGRHRQVHGQGPAGIPSVGDIALIEPSGAPPCVPAADQVGTVWALLDASGQQANTYEYDAFGVARAASETIPNPYRFGGKPLDADTAAEYGCKAHGTSLTGTIGTRACGTVYGAIIEDRWALLAERYHGAVSYLVGGLWQGSIELDCVDPDQPDRGRRNGGDGR